LNYQIEFFEQGFAVLLILALNSSSQLLK
jgi:hypothetical protein